MAIANAFNVSGGTGSSGGSGSSDGTIQQVTFTNQTSVTINHNFEHFPTVIILDSSGNVVHSDIRHTSSTQILINFVKSLTGTIIIR